MADVAKATDDAHVYQEAVKKLNDQVLLADVAKRNKYLNYPEFKNGYRVFRRYLNYALYKLADQDLIYDIAKNSEDRSVRHFAVTKLENKDYLVDIAENCEVKLIRETAKEKLEKL